MREKHVENYLKQRVIGAGGEIRKVKWIGRANAPDRRVMLPESCRPFWRPAVAFWVECKAPGEVCRPAQVREHARMRRCGETVAIVDSYASVDRLFK